MANNLEWFWNVWCLNIEIVINNKSPSSNFARATGSTHIELSQLVSKITMIDNQVNLIFIYSGD